MTYKIPDRVKKLAQEGGWIGVDLDGTMFEYHEWVAWNVFGKPIPLMIERIMLWMSAAIPVRIITARVGLPLFNSQGEPRVNPNCISLCRVTGAPFSDAMMTEAIHYHLIEHGLPRLKVQCYKDYNMIEFWDDRAVQVVANTGKTLAEEHEAELSALRGKQFDSSQNLHVSNQPHHPRG